MKIRIFATLCALLVLAPGAFAAEADDDDTREDMLQDFWRDEMTAFEYTMTNATTGEPIEGAGAIVAPTFSRDKVLVGVFIPASSGFMNSEQTVNVTVCEFMFPENCLMETPYPGAPSDYACGLSDEKRPDTGFECDSREVEVEPDGDLSVDVEIEEENEDLYDDYAESPAPAPVARKLLASARFGRANPRRSRTLRTAGARGYGRGR